jgi:hypothetical protein
MSEAPTKAELIERYGEADDLSDAMKNTERADLVRTMVEEYTKKNYGRSEALDTIVGDMISNLLHLVTMEGGDAEYAYGAGWNHFEHEVGSGYDA